MWKRRLLKIVIVGALIVGAVVLANWAPNEELCAKANFIRLIV